MLKKQYKLWAKQINDLSGTLNDRNWSSSISRL